jgi:hypothetical protein
MLEAGATALAARRGRLEWLGPIAAPDAPSTLPAGPIGRALDLLDIVAAGALQALFAAAKR